MIFLIGLILAAVFVTVCDRALKKHAGAFYIGSVVIAAAVVICTFANLTVSFPSWFAAWIWPLFARSGFATSLFVIVMFTGALPNGSVLMKKLMPIRGELSIIASILTLGHNISYGRTYFTALFGGSAAALPPYLIAASVTSLIMIVIMVPLMITSFRSVRKKMKAKSWKRLQRSAYVFYALIYAHVMILSVPMLKAGRGEYLFHIILYSAVFFTYAAMRIGKALSKKMPVLRRVPAVACLCLFVAVCAVGCSQADSDKEDPVSSLSVEDEQNDESLSADEEDQDGENVTEDENSDDQNSENTGTDDSDNENKTGGSGDSDKSNTGNSSTSTSAPSSNAGSTSKISSSGASQPASSGGTQNTSGSQSTQPSEPAQTTQKEQPSTPTYKYKNGTFTGSAQGFNGPITVSVTIQNDVIKSVSVVSASDDEPYLSNAKALTSKIVSSQSTSVSAVSGATYSSNGIINAAKAAMNSAKN